MAQLAGRPREASSVMLRAEALSGASVELGASGLVLG